MLILYWKMLNFDLLTPSPGSREVGEGVGEGKVTNIRGIRLDSA